MKLFTFPASPGCRPIAMFIADHEMKVEEHVIDLMSGQQYSPEFTALNPNSAVPVLKDEDFVLTESSAILKYLADLVDSPTYPKGLRARALVNSAMDWVNTGLYRNFGYSLCYPQVPSPCEMGRSESAISPPEYRPNRLSEVVIRNERAHARRWERVVVRRGTHYRGLLRVGSPKSG